MCMGVNSIRRMMKRDSNNPHELDLSPSARLRMLFRLRRADRPKSVSSQGQMTALKAVFSWKNAQLPDLQRPEQIRLLRRDISSKTSLFNVSREEVSRHSEDPECSRLSAREWPSFRIRPSRGTKMRAVYSLEPQGGFVP